jgi:hypothetical protein
MALLVEYKTLIENGIGGESPAGFKKIICHMFYDDRHDCWHKIHLVAGGHLTGPATESVYLCVISLRGTLLISFLQEQNKHELWGVDDGNA